MATRKDTSAAGNGAVGAARPTGAGDARRKSAKQRTTSATSTTKRDTAKRVSARKQQQPKDEIEAAVSYDRRLMEQQLEAVHRVLEEHDFATIEEANAFLQQLVESGGPPLPTPTTPLEKAQEVIYEALRAMGARRSALARKALTISPECADAYNLLAEASRTPDEARRYYEQGVAAGERALGPEAFAEVIGEFWGLLETRPYMRARQGLAEALWELDERQAAIEHAQEMLRLNPNDNQGMRYLLASWLLAVGDDAALEKLLAQYPEEGSAHWAYTRALLAFRRQGPGKEAEAALARALEANPYVPMYLLGVVPLPEEMPAYYGMGDENEAVVYLSEGAEPWTTTEGAAEWLVTSLPQLLGPILGEPSGRRSSKKRSTKSSAKSTPKTKRSSEGSGGRRSRGTWVKMPKPTE